jgi:hypothetical protein
MAFSIVGNILTNIPKNIKRCIEYVGPMIQERLDKEEEDGPDWLEKPVIQDTQSRYLTNDSL